LAAAGAHRSGVLREAVASTCEVVSTRTNPITWRPLTWFAEEQKHGKCNRNLP